MSVAISGPAYRAVFEAAPDGCVIVDENGTIRDLNPHAEELFGYSKDQLVGQQVEVLLPLDKRAHHRALRERYLEAPRARPIGMGLELTARRRDGSEIPVEISLSPMQTDEGVFVIGSVRDVSAQKRLRNFGLEALRGAEEERLRIARELHDDTAQTLSALLIRLQLARAAKDPGRREALLREMHKEIMDAAEGVYRIVRGLRPPALDEVGVVAAVREHLRDLRKGWEVKAEIRTAPVDHLLSEETKLALYRIVQEALSNVVRHSGARTVCVDIGSEGETVVATVADDGTGFDVERPEPIRGRGIGMLGMRERAHAVGGRLEVDSIPGQGTRVRFEVPVSSS